jgi:hypothetical protein
MASISGVSGTWSFIPIFILIRFWEIRSFLTNGLRESACTESDFESCADILTSGRTPQ